MANSKSSPGPIRSGRRLPFRGLPRLSWFIFALNTFALLALVGGIVAADRGRLRLIDARKQQLAEQGQIFSEALAVSAVRENTFGMKVIGGVETPIPLFNARKADEIIRNLVLPTKTRARLYDYQGHMLIDSKLLEEGGAIDRALALNNNITFMREIAIGLIIIVFLMFEPDGLAHRWRQIKIYWKLYPFSH